MFGTDGAVGCIEEMASSVRAESAAIAARLGAVSRLYAQRCRDYEEAQFWATDVFEAVAAEVSAAQNISRSRAGSQVRMAVSLFERLPRVAQVFAAGDIDYRVLRLVIARTDNVEDEIVGELDAALAARIGRWNRLSETKLRDRLDRWVASFDPAGQRVPPAVAENRYVDVDAHPTAAGMALLGGALGALDAAAFEARLTAIAATVCPDDPRTTAQRRADACGAMGRWEASLACQCPDPDCPARAVSDSAAQIVVHLLAEQGTVEGTGASPGYLPGFGVLPAEPVRQAAATARLTPVRLPGAAPEPGYRPSAGLADFLRWRDLTCRWPGCDAPVADCDIDHTVPWPAGATHASSLKHYCRTHHLIKTFYTGPRGWTDQQRPDGTIVFTAPTGHTYTSEAHGAALFAALATPTAPLTPPVAADQPPHRSAMMPRRTTTREHDRRARINRERRARLELNAQAERDHQAWLAATYEPPPF
ncbi:HNH endonuclease signature motif containing protein [Micromonospora sp. WMMD737]|uniref:HNH endonuclease signature motif containing protein n=1 Tax=Micromonospora sp. WMMD737 TaxID=3404113 RepID=UPI003B92C817